MTRTPHVTDFPDGISAVDTEYVRPMLDASHLIVQEGRAAFVDTGTSHSVPLLLAALAAKGLEPTDVDYVLVTHVHLDHAGGAGQLMAALPDATAVLHPRGAAHMADPSRLVAGSIAVYGEAMFASLYGEVLPIPSCTRKAMRATTTAFSTTAADAFSPAIPSACRIGTWIQTGAPSSSPALRRSSSIRRPRSLPWTA
jgi:glyoxylase-like metal-dependent hydrolase (beta-lactamase superfamily II)